MVLPNLRRPAREKRGSENEGLARALAQGMNGALAY
jgi:hypothetical protein